MFQLAVSPEISVQPPTKPEPASSPPLSVLSVHTDQEDSSSSSSEADEEEEEQQDDKQPPASVYDFPASPTREHTPPRHHTTTPSPRLRTRAVSGRASIDSNSSQSGESRKDR